MSVEHEKCCSMARTKFACTFQWREIPRLGDQFRPRYHRASPRYGFVGTEDFAALFASERFDVCR